jgi:hypothetical protein
MSTIIDHPETGIHRHRQVAEARAELLRRAELQGIRPFSSVVDFAGDPGVTADFDVDEFLLQVRQARDQAPPQSRV